MENISKIILLLSLLLHHTSAYQVRVLSTSIAKNAADDDRLLKWSRTELSELANIFADQLLNDPIFANSEFVEQSASKHYVDVDSLNTVFKQLETDGLALRTRIYEEIKRAGLLDDKGDIKEVLRVAPIFKEMSQRERDNLRITDLKVIQKIQPRNLIKGTKWSTTPRRWKTDGNLIANKHHQIHGNGVEKVLWTSRRITAGQSKIEQKYLRNKEKAKNYKEKSQKLEKELARREVEISDLKRSEAQYKMKVEQFGKEMEQKVKQIVELKKHMEKELEKKEKEIAKLKKESGGEGRGNNENGGIFNKIFGATKEAGGEGEKIRLNEDNSKLEAKERELYNLDRKISMKMHQLQNIQSKIGQQNNNVFKNGNVNTANGMKKVQFDDITSVIPNKKIEQKIKKAKNDESAGEMADDEAVVIKTSRQDRKLSKRNLSKISASAYEAAQKFKAHDLKHQPKAHNQNVNERQNTSYNKYVINSKVKNDDSAEENEIKTTVTKTPRRIVTLNKRNKSVANSVLNYDADAENDASPGRSKTLTRTDIERMKTTGKNIGAFQFLSPSWARQATYKQEKYMNL